METFHCSPRARVTGQQTYRESPVESGRRRVTTVATRLPYVAWRQHLAGSFRIVNRDLHLVAAEWCSLNFGDQNQQTPYNYRACGKDSVLRLDAELNPSELRGKRMSQATNRYAIDFIAILKV